MEEDLSDWEPAEDLLDYLEAEELELTRSQLVRLHKEGLIPKPKSQYEKGRRGSRTLYEPGTLIRLRRILEVKKQRKVFDEIAWTLFWDGDTISMDQVRKYLYKVAKRYDNYIAKFRRKHEAPVGEPAADQFDEIDEQIRVGPRPPALIGAIRKRLKSKADQFDCFVDVVYDVLLGDLGAITSEADDLFERTLGFDETSLTPLRLASDGALSADFSAVGWMTNFLNTPLLERARSMSDDDLIEARDEAKWMTEYVVSLGEVMRDFYKGAGLGYALAGRALTMAKATSENQVILTIIFHALRQEPEMVAGRAALKIQAAEWKNNGFESFRRIRILAAEIPALHSIMTPSRLAAAFKSEAVRQKYQKTIEEFREQHFEELQDAIARHPELFKAPALDETRTEGELAN